MKVKAKDTNKYLKNAFIWSEQKVLGKTDKNGLFKTRFKPGKYEFKVVAKGYNEQVVVLDLLAGKKNTTEVIMIPENQNEQEMPVDENTFVPAQDEDDGDISERTVPSFEEKPYKQSKTTNKKTRQTPVSRIEDQDDDDTTTEQQVVVCLNCGYVNTAPAGKKIRFCVNCAKPLK